MADCSALAAEQDDLHRRWLPREIFADIGIPDAAPPAAAVEDAAAHFTGKIAAVQGPPPPPPPPPPGIFSYPGPQPQVCGLQAMACLPPYAYATGPPPPPPPCPWPLVYCPLQWQMPVVPSVFLGDPRYNYPAPPLGGAGVGTGVFLPRAGAGYQHLQHKAAPAASPAPATDGRLLEKKNKNKKQRQQQEQQGKEEEEQRSQQEEEDHEAAAEVLLALPQEWTY
ncbi:formin-like protein 3 [Brachypodium distachyon]|uniref:Uncharacterized protein n=1 Tax=Brachypodium distachyon TaxID=15368 RepID=A0A0Q3J1D3_BRADI|nr:formin-like protein 3 [Brachypodium distachyon]KQJ92160.1 hypothetical protein BRADI_4g41973v3 [Brachypodium distachyon]|eukprot:XP_010239499.1 formin-like protein 3 [Brachypodium distachyon]